MLVIKNGDIEGKQANREEVEKVIMDHNIPVTQSYQNKVGDYVVVCDTKDKRDELKDLVSSTNQEVVLRTPAEKRHSITIVGLSKQYEKEEVLHMLELQNGFIKGFASKNDLKQHIQIYTVRPLKNNPSVFQVFANISSTLREGFTYFKNKVTLGLQSCRIYDQYHIKRCNNCQHFGHYIKECPTPDMHACGICSSTDHQTKDCESQESKCINCIRNKVIDCNHYANSLQCPSMKKEQEAKKKRLNLSRNSVHPPP